MPLIRITPADLDVLSSRAAARQRRRLNLNLHVSSSDLCQRLFNALEPDSYVQPHRHLQPPKRETFVAVRGSFALFLFADDGTLTGVERLGREGLAALEIPAGLWHSVAALTPGSIFFEVKPGPYRPDSDKEPAPWAPAEGNAEAPAYLAGLLACLAGGEG